MDRDQSYQPYDPQHGAAFRSMIVLIVAAVVLLLVARWRQPRMPNEWAGRPLPPLEAAGWLNTDQPVTADELLGKVVLVDFWVTTCGPCVAAMPALGSLQERYRLNDVVVIGLTPESAGEAQLEQFLKNRPRMDWPIGYGAVSVFNHMGIFATPTYVVYDRNGRSTWGGHSLAQAEDAIVEALTKPINPAESE
jgi:thiol-disulfide isomerase/thioredoxin